MHCQRETMKHLLITLLFVPIYLFASLGVYERPSDKEVFDGSDVVAIVRTIKGEVIPIENGGGVKVTSRVIYPVKGVDAGSEIEIYYGAGSIGGRYVATLIWDHKLNAYRYFDTNMSYEVFHVNTIEQDFLNPQEISEARGFKGKVEKPKGGIYFLPSCDLPAEEAFDQIQYIVKKAE